MYSKMYLYCTKTFEALYLLRTAKFQCPLRFTHGQEIKKNEQAQQIEQPPLAGNKSIEKLQVAQLLAVVTN